MTAKDQRKVLSAGFIILRKETYSSWKGKGEHNFILKIKRKTKSYPEWRDFEINFPSQAARDARLKQLLKDPLIIED